ncbi:MAG: thioester domain-containing protein [Solobacterium sp.]|nr:thioester domain-containing protein [Solobacterium sp.]
MIGVNKGIQRTLVILMSLFCMMTSVLRVHAVDSIDDTGTLRYENCINSVDGGYIWKYLESTSSNCIAPRFMVDDAVAYCLEPQVHADPGTIYNASDPSAFEWPSPQAKNRIMLIAYFAYGYKGDYSDERYLGGWYLVWRQMGEFFMHQFSTHNGDMGSYNYAIEAKMAEIDQLVDAYLRKPLFKVENLNSGTVFDNITDTGTVFASRGDTLRFTAIDHTLDGYTVSADGGGTITRQEGDIIEVKWKQKVRRICTLPKSVMIPR